MRWTCPKCGKKLNISNEQLIANDGVIVCPQCLLQARQPVPKARVTERDGSATPPPRRQRQSINFDDNEKATERKPATPPPHKTRVKPATTSYRYTGLTGGDKTATSTTATRTTPKKKSSKKKKKKQSGMSAWGCLGRTILFTLLLFAAYVFFGLLLEALQ